MLKETKLMCQKCKNPQAHIAINIYTSERKCMHCENIWTRLNDIYTEINITSFEPKIKKSEHQEHFDIMKTYLLSITQIKDFIFTKDFKLQDAIDILRALANDATSILKDIDTDG